MNWHEHPGSASRAARIAPARPVPRAWALILAALALALNLPRPAQAAERVLLDRVKIVVSNLVLTERELESIFQLQSRDLRERYSGPELEKRLADLRRDITERMVEDLLVENQARTLGIEIKEEDIDRRVDAIVAREPTVIATYGEEELKRFVHKDLLKQQVLQREVQAFVHVESRDVKEACLAQRRESREVHVAHILLRAGDEAARARLEEIRAEIAGGLSFGEAARKYSQDPKAAQNQGDLGFIARGQFVKAFEDAAFALEPGQVSAPVKTELGYHLIQVQEERVKEATDCENMDEITRNRFYDQVYNRERDKRLKEYLAKLRATADIQILNGP
jgi:parvulin-like peptidyl-prolyl isomerase